MNPLFGVDLHWLLAQQASARGAHPWLVFEPVDGRTVTLSYEAFADQARRCACGLQRRGVQAGDRVLLHLDNCAEFLVAWFGAALAGAIAVTTNTRAADAELRYFVDHSEPVCAITQPRLAAQVARCAPALRFAVVIDHDAGEAAAAAQRPAREQGFAQLLAQAPPDGPLVEPNPDRPMAIQYTSGTTSRPKGVLWTHANALWAGAVSATHQMLRPDDVHACVLPLFHTNALSYSMLASLWAGATLVLQPRFSSSRYWEVANRHRCTWASITGFCWKALTQVERPAAHHFRHWGVAAAHPLIGERFGIQTISWWGMTETLTHGIVSTPGLSMPPGAIGRPAREYGVRIVDAEGRPVGLGQTGELQILGRPGVSLFAGYFRDAEATARSFDADGWFLTGDAVTLHPQGLISFADRTKDMLKVGGENVASIEIERVVGAVDGVEEAIVVARPHAMLDEVPVAFVVPVAAAAGRSPAQWQELVLARCRADLADFKVPREVHVITEVPRTSIGKVEKARLRRDWAERWHALAAAEQGART
jgi:crotonobetaine/carnitine-CoA ligase